MSNSMGQVCGAQLPVERLAELAELRTHSGLQAVRWSDQLWLSWPPGEPELTVRLLALPGAVLLTREGADGSWRRWGQRLPIFAAPPEDAYRPLSRLLVPDKLDIVTAPDASDGTDRTGESLAEAVAFRLVRSGRYRPTAGLRAATIALGDWLDTAASAEIESFRAAVTGSGVAGQVLLLGASPPTIADAVRYWLQPLSRGCQLYVPLGLELWPTVPPARLVDLLDVPAGSVLLAEVADPPRTADGAGLNALLGGSVLDDSGLLGAVESELSAAELDPSEPGSSAPGFTEPGSSAPGFTEPGFTEPDASEPPPISWPLSLTVIDGDVLTTASRAALRRALADAVSDDES